MSYSTLTTSLEMLRTAATNLSEGQLDNPTPCAEWSIAQVLHHAAGDQHAWAAAIGDSEQPGYNPFDPPQTLDHDVVTVVTSAIKTANSAWSQITSETVPTPLPPAPTLATPLAAAACALDAAIHAWDVCVASEQPTMLTPELAAELTPAAEATAESLRGFAYAPALPPQPNDDAASALLRYLGRDPQWKP